jgi:hypothetical protein
VDIWEDETLGHFNGTGKYLVLGLTQHIPFSFSEQNFPSLHLYLIHWRMFMVGL